MATLTPKQRRAALEVLSRDRLAEITTKFELAVEDRRAQAAHVDSIISARKLDFADVLRELSRDELKSMCSALGIDSSGKEKGMLIERILGRGGSGGTNGNGEDFSLTAQDAKAPRRAQPASSRTRPSGGEPTGDYRHDATRKNNPPAGLIDLDKPPAQRKKHYGYDPHLDPQLQWAGKAEHTSFDVDTVSLHIHERISTQAIMHAVRREEAQRTLFAQDDLPESKAIDFYAHDVGWSNRLVLGDSLLVMNSLLERERMAGRVQCAYLDPPYGVRFNSNFQPLISRREVKDDDSGLTREPETIQAFRDTWTLGVHSYLSYLRDRLLLVRELLHESGSVFVQISDENLHHVRELMDEVFGADCAVVTICIKKKGGQKSGLIDPVNDYLVWYAKSPRESGAIKFRQLFEPRDLDFDTINEFKLVELRDRSTNPLRAVPTGKGNTTDYSTNPRQLFRDHPGARLMRPWPITNGGERPNQMDPVEFGGHPFRPPKGRCWSFRSRKVEGETTSPMERLARCGRLYSSGESLDGKRYLEDFPFKLISNWWDGLGGAADPIYVVQTNTEIVKRCILMTTDPGDLVFDPTCGSGTTAFVAEEWGRRWITCDTSRVAMALARQRLLTARFRYYRLRSSRVRDGFHYRTAARIILGGIANNTKLDEITDNEQRERVIRESAHQEVLYDQPEEDKSKVRVSGPFTVEAIPVASMEDSSASPIPQLEPEARDDDVARPGRGAGAITDAGGDYIERMIDLLRKTGVQFKGGRSMPLASLRPVKTPHEYLHAEADTGYEGDPRRVAISLGPPHGPVTPKQVLDSISQTRDYDIVLFVGFACDPEAGRMIEDLAKNPSNKREWHFVHAAPDILVGDLLKDTKATKLFTVFGLPDVKIGRAGKEITVALTGVDLYDPVTGETTHDDGESVAAWFLDHDYDGRTFFICQAFFPSGKAKNPWEKIQKALKGTIDEDKFEALRTTTSIPFKPGRKIAVKVIDDRGNEVVKVVEP